MYVYIIIVDIWTHKIQISTKHAFDNLSEQHRNTYVLCRLRMCLLVAKTLLFFIFPATFPILFADSTFIHSARYIHYHMFVHMCSSSFAESRRAFPWLQHAVYSTVCYSNNKYYWAMVVADVPHFLKELFKFSYHSPFVLGKYFMCQNFVVE